MNRGLGLVPAGLGGHPRVPNRLPVVQQDVTLTQDADGPPRVVDDGGRPEAAVGEQGDGFPDSRVGAEGDRVGAHQLGSGRRHQRQFRPGNGTDAHGASPSGPDSDADPGYVL